MYTVDWRDGDSIYSMFEMAPLPNTTKNNERNQTCRKRTSESF